MREVRAAAMPVQNERGDIMIPVEAKRPVGRPCTRQSGQSKRYSIRMDYALYKQFRRTCARLGLVRNSLVERMIANFVAQNQKNNSP